MKLGDGIQLIIKANHHPVPKIGCV
jgi:hypothetical protein